MLVFVVPLAAIVLTGSPSPSGVAYVIGPLAIAIALTASRPWTKRVAVAGVALVVLMVTGRIATTPSAGDTRVIDRVIDERDVTVNAARAIRWTHVVRDPDVARLPEAMRDAYDEMHREEGALPSPLVPTMLGLQGAHHASDTLEFVSSSYDPGAKAAREAVIFLHGSTGNYTLSCWLFARAAARAHMTTSCPSTRFAGDWWQGGGETIVRETVESLHKRGYTRIFLAGLSNGGFGASRLAPRTPGVFAGLILVSGAASDAPDANIPTLVIQGRDDALVSTPSVHAYAMMTGSRYEELPGGHFALLVERNRASNIIATWLTSQTGDATSRAREP